MAGKKEKLFPVELFDFKINNVEAFINRQHPEINPLLEESRYRAYWEEFALRCMNGFWGEDRDGDEGGWRFMPNNMHTYANLFQFEMQGTDGAKTGITDYPFLRACDWFLEYRVTECEGFAGYKDNKYESSSTLLYKKANDLHMTLQERKMFDHYGEYFHDPYGKLKTYISPREALWKTYDEPQGEALYINESQNDIWITTRRYGKTYHGLVKGFRGMIFNNAHTIDEYYSHDTKFKWVLGSSEDDYTEENYDKFFDAWEAMRKIGSYHDREVSFEGAFWRDIKGSKSLGRIMTNKEPLKGGKGMTGPGSTMTRVSYAVNKSAGVGKAVDYYFNEEIGKWSNYAEVYAENDKAQKRETKFGEQLGIGTGGDIDKIETMRPIIYNPSLVGAIGMKDHFRGRDKEIACIVPVYYRKISYHNENGNLLLQEAFDAELIDRMAAKEKGMKAYRDHISGFPFNDDDIFMQVSSIEFPTDRASERLGILQAKPIEEKEGQYIGKFVDYGDRVDFVEDNSLYVIRKQSEKKDLSKEQQEGAVCMYEPPDLSGQSLYFGVHDGSLHDAGSSFVASAIFKIYGPPGTIQFNYVCDWIGRKRTRDMSDKVSLDMCAYYNCLLCPETNAPNILDLAEKLRKWDMLMDCPYEAMNSIMKCAMKYTKGVYLPGGNSQMKKGLEILGGEIMRRPVEDPRKMIKENSLIGELEEDTQWMVDQIQSEFFADNIIYFNLKGNFEYISLHFIVSLVLKQMEMMGGYSVGEVVKQVDDISNFVEGLRKSKNRTNRVFRR